MQNSLSFGAESTAQLPIPEGYRQAVLHFLDVCDKDTCPKGRNSVRGSSYAGGLAGLPDRSVFYLKVREYHGALKVFLNLALSSSDNGITVSNMWRMVTHVGI